MQTMLHLQMVRDIQNVAGPDFEYGEGYVIRASTNNHMWVGAVSNYETQLNEKIFL